MCQKIEVSATPESIKENIIDERVVKASGTMLPFLPELTKRSVAFFSGPYTKRKILLLFLVGSLLVGSIGFLALYKFHTGFRRTIQFWRGIGPLALQYKLLKFKAFKINNLNEDDDEYKRRITEFRVKTAPQLVDLTLKLGGIYIKIGQVISTIGQGLLPEEYLVALRPLQDGVPPRSYEQIRDIIETSTKKNMSQVFVEFDETPIGAASIAQAHRARLRPLDNSKDKGEEVIVKIQYPEVAEMFEADIDNLELVTRWFNPENMELVKSLRERHNKELDFTIEAENLRECTANMQRYGVEPSLVRIPRVRNETGICNKNVLVMEYLKGTSLSDVIKIEQDRMAQAMGKQDAKELRKDIMDKMKDHFEQGGGETSSTEFTQNSWKSNKLLQVLPPTLLADAFQTYVRIKEHVDDILYNIKRIFPVQQKHTPKLTRTNFKLKPLLKTLVHVHGLQILKDGVYNADPHPGNVLVLNDGRLGLLDYGMVGRLSDYEREAMAKSIVALSTNNKTAVATIYNNSGYLATFNSSDITDANILHRFATFHLDKFDLSPLKLQNGQEVELRELMRNTREKVIPPWIEDGRRLGGLLQGVCIQAARPISLAKEWKNIAHQVVKHEFRSK